MDRRSWPWHKKSCEKITGPEDSTEASPAHSTRHLDEQTMARDHTGCFPDKEIDQRHQMDETAEQLKERLSVALLDASAKDLLVKQHAKVAEEAVTGWRKAEVEAQSLKEDLESVMQQKIATEDRVSHLDDALKECMSQLRHAREDQEAKIHDATMKNLRDWEKSCAELEERLADMEERAVAADAEKKTMSQMLQKRAVKLIELDEARSCAESNLNVLQNRFEAMEREFTSVKHRYSKLMKEFDCRNEEKVSIRRPVDVASKQNLENTRKIVKLEEECQRLRDIVRTKHPGCGVSVQVKSDPGVSKLKIDSSKRKPVKGAAASREKKEDGQQWIQESPSGGKDADAWLNRLKTMEDETGRLKELLVRRDNELQQSRLMCARTASKLSSVEEQLESLLHDMGSQKATGISPLDKHIESARSLTVSCEPSLASVSEDGNDDCSDAWASALISELAHIKTDKTTFFQESSVDTSNLQPVGVIKAGDCLLLPPNDTKCEEQNLVLYAGHQRDFHGGGKFHSAEREVPTSQPENATTELQSLAVQCQLNAFLQAQDDKIDVNASLHQVPGSIGMSLLQNEQTKEPFVIVDQSLVKPRLMSTVSKLAKIAGNLGVAVTSANSYCKNNGSEANCRKLSSEGELHFQGAADAVQFLEDLSSALGGLVRIKLAEKAEISCETWCAQHNKDVSISSDSMEMICTCGPLIPSKESGKGFDIDPNQLFSARSEQEFARLEGELRRVQGEKVALETHMRMEFQRFEVSQKEISQLQSDKVALEHLVGVIKVELDNLRLQLQQAEVAESSCQEKLSSMEASKQLLEEQLQSSMLTTSETESQLQLIKAEYVQLQDTHGILKRECVEKSEKLLELEIKCQELSNCISQNSTIVCSKCSAANGGILTQKEEEIALKLAECQKTILCLGKQLKTFTSSKEHFNNSSDPSINKPEAYQSPNHYNNPCNPSSARKGNKHPFDTNAGTLAYKQLKLHVQAQKEVGWESQRDSNASDTLDLELMNLSKSGRPLLELFGNKTPAHEHYIKAVEQLTSSSDDEFILPKKMDGEKSSTKHLSHRKKKSQRSYKVVDMSKSMDDDASREKLNTFTRFFSRAKNP